MAVKRIVAFPWLGGGRWLTVELDGVAYPVQIRVGKSEDGRLICTGLKLGTLDGGNEVVVADQEGRELPIHEAWGTTADREWEVTARSLRGVHLPEILELVAMVDTVQSPDSQALFFRATGRAKVTEGFIPPFEGQRTPRGPRGYTREHWETVAATYREALLKRPRNPHAYIAKHLYTSEPTARRWVMKCRDLGLLGEAQAGKAGELPADSE